MASFKKFLVKPLTFSILLVLLAFGALAIWRDRARQDDLAQEIDRQRSSVVELDAERVRLTDMVELLESADFVEKEARLRLGLAKPGEKVISVPENARPVAGASTTVTFLEMAKPNPQLWFDYFFSRDKDN